MRFFRLFLATLWLAALAFDASSAQAAGTISVSPPTWANRVTGRLINKFNRQDCLDDAKATFSVAVRGAPTNALFQVWSGTGCDQYANRSPTAVSNTCTLLTGELAPVDQTVVIHLRDMLAAYNTSVTQSEAQCDATSTAGLQTRTLYFVVSDTSNNMTLATGNSTWPFTYDVKAPPPPSDVSAGSGDGSLVTSFKAPSNETNLLRYKFYCSVIGDSPAAATNTGGTSASVSGQTAGTTAVAAGGTDTGGTATAGIDTGGTATETGGTIGIDTGGTATETGGTIGTDTGGTATGTGGTAAIGTDTGGTAATGTDIGGSATGGTDTSGANAAATAGTDTTGAGGSTGTTGVGAGTAGTAGTATTAVDPNCQSAVLIPGQPPPDTGAETGVIDCGEVTAQGANGGETSPVLSNDIKYVVAIAAEDNVNNIGVLSALACNVPKDTTGFIEAYGEAGGRAGGGFCAFAPAKNGAIATLVALVIGGCALARRRK